MVLGCLMCLETNQKAWARLLCCYYSISVCYVPSLQVHGAQEDRTQSCCPLGTSEWKPGFYRLPQIFIGTSLVQSPSCSWQQAACSPPACSQVTDTLVQPSRAHSLPSFSLILLPLPPFIHSKIFIGYLLFIKLWRDNQE